MLHQLPQFRHLLLLQRACLVARRLPLPRTCAQAETNFRNPWNSCQLLQALVPIIRNTSHKQTREYVLRKWQGCGLETTGSKKHLSPFGRNKHSCSTKSPKSCWTASSQTNFVLVLLNHPLQHLTTRFRRRHRPAATSVLFLLLHSPHRYRQISSP